MIAILFCLINNEVSFQLKKFFGDHIDTRHQSMAMTQYTVCVQSSMLLFKGLCMILNGFCVKCGYSLCMSSFGFEPRFARLGLAPLPLTLIWQLFAKSSLSIEFMRISMKNRHHFRHGLTTIMHVHLHTSILREIIMAS